MKFSLFFFFYILYNFYVSLPFSDDGIGFTLEDAQAQVDTFDRDGDGTLSFKEFKRMFRRLMKVSTPRDTRK